MSLFEIEIASDPRGLIFLDAARFTDMVEWHRTAKELREEAPVLRVEAEGFRPFYALTRHEDVFEVSRRSDIWHNTKDSVLGPELQFEFIRALGIDPKTLIHLDGEEHRDHRQVTNNWFKPAAVKSRQGDIEAVADEYVQKMVDMGGECDFAQDIAVPYTLRVIMSIFGVPKADEQFMLQLTQGLFGAADPEYLGDATDPGELVRTTIGKFGDYFNALAAERRKNPTDDLATVIANGEVGGCPMDDDATLWYFIIVATAGHDTTSYGLSGGMEALLRHPDQVQALRNDPELAVNASEEMIRWTTPVRHFLRYAQEDTSIGGVDIPAGERVYMSYPSANRDADVFERPDEFDITRTDADKLLSFGLGVHYCLGSQFARREIRTILPKILDRVDDLQIASDPQWCEAAFVGGVKHLPVSYTAR